MNTEQPSVICTPSSVLGPLVSICLPTLNARRFLEPRMASILSQTLTDWELIVCDSFSDDGTWEYLQQFKDDPRVRLYQVSKEGLYAGWNECLRRCRGEYVYMATADDTCEASLLEKMVGALEKAESGKRKAEMGRGRGEWGFEQEEAEVTEGRDGEKAESGKRKWGGDRGGGF
jgi:glycosyltransferase involved in cell wall biosynthesis